MFKPVDDLKREQEEIQEVLSTFTKPRNAPPTTSEMRKRGRGFSNQDRK